MCRNKCPRSFTPQPSQASSLSWKTQVKARLIFSWYVLEWWYRLLNILTEVLNEGIPVFALREFDERKTDR